MLGLLNDWVGMSIGHVLAGEGSFQGGEGTRAEMGIGKDLAEVDSGECFKGR